jgi:segregation and condensation protein B
MARRRPAPQFDIELEDLPREMRWREWIGRIETVIFAAPQPVPRAVLASVVGRDANLDQLIRDIRAELRGRPYDLAAVAGGWQLRTRSAFGPAIRAARVVPETESGAELSASDGTVLVTIAYFQPVTRAELRTILGRDVGRDSIARLRDAGLIAPSPRSPQPGALYTYVTTPEFLVRWGLDGLHELPDLEKLQDAGLLSKADALAALGAPPPPEET